MNKLSAKIKIIFFFSKHTVSFTYQNAAYFYLQQSQICLASSWKLAFFFNKEYKFTTKCMITTKTVVVLQTFAGGKQCMCVCAQDHDVQEDKILLVSLLMAEMGVHSVAYAFPQVKIITTAVDKKVNDLFHIIPGIGKQLG